MQWALTPTMGTHTNIAQTIRDKQANYVQAVKDNQAFTGGIDPDFLRDRTRESLETHAAQLRINPREGSRTPERDSAAGRSTPRQCLSNVEQWLDHLETFGVIEAKH
jgi:hypothetical protein